MIPFCPHLLGYTQIVLNEQNIADLLYEHVFGAVSVSVFFSSFFQGRLYEGPFLFCHAFIFARPPAFPHV